MTSWTNDEINKIGTAEELRIAPRRADGTLRNPVTIWVVRVGDDLYVRPVNGRDSAWFRGTQARYEGRIRAGGLEKDATFVEVPETDRDVQAQIDAAYREKYRRYSSNIVNSVLTPEARSGTIKLIPRITA